MGLRSHGHPHTCDDCRTYLNNEMFYCTWQASKSRKYFLVLDPTANLILASLRPGASKLLRIREGTKQRTHLQSSKSIDVCGPIYERTECEGNGMYAPGPPMIADLNGCLSNLSSNPSTSAEIHAKC
jgi:hypothetical protein